MSWLAFSAVSSYFKTSAKQSQAKHNAINTAGSLRVDFDTRQVERYLSQLERSGVQRAAARSLNDTATTVRAQGARELKQQGGFSRVGDVKAKLNIRKARQGSLVAIINATGKASNLIRFGARQVKAGVSHKAWNRRQTATGAFIGNAGRTVFARRGPKRLPIKALWGPSIPNEFNREPMPTRMQQLARKVWPDKFRSRMQYEINKAKR